MGDFCSCSVELLKAETEKGFEKNWHYYTSIRDNKVNKNYLTVTIANIQLLQKYYSQY